MEWKVKKLTCPSCGAGIEMDVKGQSNLFCPFCGGQFVIDDGNTTKNINIHMRYTDDAAIEEQRRKALKDKLDYKEKKWNMLWLMMLMVICFGLMAFLIGTLSLYEQRSIDAGMIKVGQSSEEMIEKNYKTIMEQLEGAGFTNITTVDLNDAGWFSKKKDLVESVSIGGDLSFNASDYFYPDEKVVISYH